MLLKWNNGNRRLMFWLQDKNDAKDAENISKFNDFVKNPNQAQAAASPASAAGKHCVDFFNFQNYFRVQRSQVFSFVLFVYQTTQEWREESNGCRC